MSLNSSPKATNIKLSIEFEDFLRFSSSLWSNYSSVFVLPRNRTKATRNGTFCLAFFSIYILFIKWNISFRCSLSVMCEMKSVQHRYKHFYSWLLYIIWQSLLCLQFCFAQFWFQAMSEVFQVLFVLNHYRVCDFHTLLFTFIVHSFLNRYDTVILWPWSAHAKVYCVHFYRGRRRWIHFKEAWTNYCMLWTELIDNTVVNFTKCTLTHNIIVICMLYWTP